MKKLATIFTALAVIPAFVFAQQSVPLTAPKAQSYTPLSKLNPGEYLPKTMLVKVTPQFRSACGPNSIAIDAVQKYFSSLGVYSVEKTFPTVKAPEKATNAWGAPMIDLTTIYTVKFNADMDLEKAIGKLFNMGFFEYVEPYFIPSTKLTPNDQFATSASSYHIYKIVAASTSGMSGWDISTGSASIVIGITDTGTELSHPDLTNQIAYNTADPIDGNDNDGDSYTDNYRGWDVGMNDNDPTWQGDAHGVHVSGCASAQVNNTIGVAGSGYNCKFLPVKIADASGTLIASYQGITYAADHGCKVINCSWGGTGGGSFGQNVIDYATNNTDALVIAASGNNSQDQAFYPAAFDRVLSVASTGSNDIRSSFSNYNYTVDVCSPGSNINATWTGGSYTTQSGTSMASPVCAGAAAIVRAYYPSYNALQAGQRLKQTTDYIYSIGSNSLYMNKLGTGRINLYKALTDPAAPSIVWENKLTTDNNDNAFVINDTMFITGDFKNYLANATGVTATLTAVSGGTYVTIIDGSTSPGSINTLQAVNNGPADPFKVKINTNAPANQNVIFKVSITDGTYTFDYFFTEVVNVDYINVAINDVSSSITSKGLIGYNMDAQQQGLGFTYMNSGSLLYEASLMIGKSSTAVSDMARGTTTPDVDFASLSTVRVVIPSVVSDFDLDGKFRDNIAPTPIPVTVHHKAYAWSAPPSTKYIMVQYVMTNTSGSTLSNIYAGIFADWDIDATTYNDNRAGEDVTNKMGYVYHTLPGIYCGVKLLSNTAPFLHYAIDNVQGGAGGVDLYTNGYDAAEKYTTLSTGRATAGFTTGTGNDVCDVVSAGPYTINPGDSAVVAFALIAGDDLADLQGAGRKRQPVAELSEPG
ncbi:MAG: subtilisin-like serine protease [Bacteroidetes bacterium]|nr:MAG: subtilisin-like serine protease [Bacteroidota bacterium]